MASDPLASLMERVREKLRARYTWQYQGTAGEWNSGGLPDEAVRATLAALVECEEVALYPDALAVLTALADEAAP